MSKIKSLLCELIEKERATIIDIGSDLFKNPELGFKEFRTADIAAKFLKDNGIEVHENISITGLKSSLGDSFKKQGDNNKGINIGLIAELDAVPAKGHKYSSEDKGAAHACAHSNQVAIMLGVMKALKTSNILEKSCGNVTLICTPAEEFTDLDYRGKLLEDNKIKYMSGKQDMIANGVFDDVDLIISCHTMGGIRERKADINSSLNGFIYKKIIYHGKASHAGAAPQHGINALNAAVIGLSAVNAQRETFMDEDNMRVHGIITDGGQNVNTIPETVAIEAYVRGRSWQSIADASSKVDRAFKAGAYAVGGTCEIINTIGYVPFEQCRDLSAVLKENMASLIGGENIIDGAKSMASGDIGDLAALKPTIQFGFSGFSGNVHGSDFDIVDEEMAYIIPAKAIVMTIYDLLKDDCRTAKKIIEDNPPMFTREQYIENWLKNDRL